MHGSSFQMSLPDLGTLLYLVQREHTIPSSASCIQLEGSVVSMQTSVFGYGAASFQDSLNLLLSSRALLLAGAGLPGVFAQKFTVHIFDQKFMFEDYY